jgi:hypothetical protein
MLIRLRTILSVTTSSLILAVAAGCGSNPTSPTSLSSWGARQSGAVITGVAMLADGQTSSGLTVTVMGSNRSATVDDDGNFQVLEVPPGVVRLQFRNSSVNATAQLGAVSDDDFVEIRVRVNATSAEILDEVRSGKVTLCHLSDDGRYHRIDISENAEPAHRDHGDGAIGEQVPADPTKIFDARCQAVGPSVAIEKSTSGEDADDAPGPSITLGSAVTWTYLVTNDGTAPLTGVVVTDDRGVTVSCNGQTTLAVGASMTCTGTGVVTEEGQYANVGSVTANWSTATGSGTVTDADPSHYLGISPLVIEKLTNGEDADHAPGPSITVGDPVAWEYVVSNIGTVPLTAIAVVDDRGVAVTCGQTTLAPGATMTCTGMGTAVLGQYSNVGTATATWTAASGTASGTVSESDPSHYIGVSLDEEEGQKVSLCHRTGAGFYVLINVSIDAEPAHMAHGDGKPGGAVPGRPGQSFSAGCGVQ